MAELIGAVLAIVVIFGIFSGNEENPIDNRNPVSKDPGKDEEKKEKGAHEKDGASEPPSAPQFVEAPKAIVMAKTVPSMQYKENTLARLVKRAVRGTAPTYSHSLGETVATPRRGRRVLAKVIGFRGRQLVLRHHDGLIVRRSPMNIFTV